MIPKIIHQIWVGPYRIPKREKRFSDEVKENHPTFEYKLWTDSDVPRLPPRLQEIYDYMGSVGQYAFQADLLRVFLVYNYGGIYLDIDFEYLPKGSGFNNIPLENYTAFFINHDTVNPAYHHLPAETLNNGGFGAEKNHPIFDFLLEDISWNYPEYPNVWMGPSWLANAVKKYFKIDGVITQIDLAKNYFDTNKILHIDHYDKFEKEYFKHHSLASWQPEMFNKFKTGAYE
jgi:mannosyltransferase OCH1-like enzyme